MVSTFRTRSQDRRRVRRQPICCRTMTTAIRAWLEFIARYARECDGHRVQLRQISETGKTQQKTGNTKLHDAGIITLLRARHRAGCCALAVENRPLEEAHRAHDRCGTGGSAETQCAPDDAGTAA